jgi:TP901 family phage tail tape measure protein
MADTVEKHTVEYNVASAVRAADALSKALVDQAAAMELVANAANQIKSADFTSQFIVAKRAIDLLNKLEKDAFNEEKTQEQLKTRFLKEEQAKRRAERKKDEADARAERKRTNTELVKDVEERGKAETKQVLAEGAARTKELENLIKAGEQRLTKEHLDALTARQNLDKENAKKLKAFDEEILRGEQKTRDARAKLETTFANEQHRRRVTERVDAEKAARQARERENTELRNAIQQRYKDEDSEAQKRTTRNARIGNSFAAVHEKALASQTKVQQREQARQEKVLKDSFKAQQAATSQFKSSLSKLNPFGALTDSADTFGGALKAIVTFGAINRITSELSASIGRAADLQIKIAEIQTLSQRVSENGQTAGTFRTDESIRKDIAALSNATGLDQLDIAAAAYEAVSNQIAGAAENFDFLEESAKFALATVSTQNDAVQLLSATLNSYNLAATRAAEVSAIWFKAIDLGRFTVAELSLDIGRSAVLGNQLGITLEELAAAYSTMTIQGVKFANAQTFLTNIMLKLIKPTEEMKGIFNEWGVTSGQAAVEIFGLNGVLRKLDDVSKQSGDRLGELGEQFSTIRAIVGATILGDNADQFDKNLQQISAAQEAFQEAFDIRITNSGQIIKKELTEIQNFFTNELGDSIVKALANFSSGTQDISDGFERVLELLTKAVPALVAFRSAFNIASTIQTSITALAAYRAATITASAATATLGAAATITGAALTLGLSLIPVAIGAVAGYIGYEAVNSLQLFGSEGEKAFDKINEAADKFLKTFKAQSILEFQQTADEVTNSFEFLSKGLALAQVKKLSEVNRLVKGIISGTEVFQDALSRGFAASEIELNKQVFLLKDFNNVIDDVQREVNKLSEDFKSFSDELETDFKTVDKTIQDAVESMADFRKEAALARKSPDSISDTVVASKFQDEISKLDEIADVRERVKALLSASKTKEGEGLSLFNVGKIEEGNTKTQEAIALLNKTKELIAELKKSEPETALGLPSVEEITKRFEALDKEIQKRRTATELPKVFGLINESNVKSQEAFAALEDGELEKAQEFFKNSQSLFKEASNLADTLRSSGIKVPLTNEFANAFDARTQEFAAANDQIRQDLIRTQAEALSKTAAAQIAEIAKAQEELGKMAEGVTEKFVDNAFSTKIQEEIAGLGKTAQDLANEFNNLIDAVSRGILDPEEAGKKFDSIQKDRQNILDRTKASNEEITNKNREALDLQSKQEQALSRIADRYKEIETEAARGDEAAVKRIRELEAANIADLIALKETGVELSEAAKVAAADFSNQISLNLDESGAKLEGLIQELEGISSKAQTLDIRGTINAAIEDPTRITELSNLFDELRKEGNTTQNAVLDKLTNATTEYSNQLNTFNNVKTGLDGLAEGRLDIDAKLVSTTQILVEALKQRIELEKEQNRVLEASDALKKVNAELETTTGSVNNSIGDFSTGVQRATDSIKEAVREQLKKQSFEGTDEQVQAVLNGQNVVQRFEDPGLGFGRGGEPVSANITFDNNGNFGNLGSLLTNLKDLDNRIKNNAISQEELNQVLPQAKEQFNQLANAINETIDSPDLTAIGRFIDTGILDQAKAVNALPRNEVIDNSLTSLFNEASPAANRQAAAESLATQLSVVATSEKNTDDQLERDLLVLSLALSESAKKFESVNKDNSKFQEVLADISKALIAVEGDKVIGRAPLDELVGNKAEIEGALKAEQETLIGTLKSLGFTDLEIADVTKDTFKLDETRNDLLSKISGNTEGLSPTLNFVLNRLSEVNTRNGVPFFEPDPVARAIGGRIPRRGTDSVMTALTPGEFVIRKSVADRIGTGALHMLNNGVVPQTLAGGGFASNDLKRIFEEIKEQGRSLFAAELNKIGLELENISTSTIDARNRIFAVGSYSAKSKGDRVPTDKASARRVFKIPGMSTGLPIGDNSGFDLTSQLLAENQRLEVSSKAAKLREIGEELYRQQAGALGYSVESISSNVDTKTGAFKVFGSVLKRKSVPLRGFEGPTTSALDVPTQFDLKKYLTTLASGGFVPNRKDISGLGTDSVLAALTPGEFVIKASAAKKLGPAFLKSINGYAKGGEVLNDPDLLRFIYEALNGGSNILSNIGPDGLSRSSARTQDNLAKIRKSLQIEDERIRVQRVNNNWMKMLPQYASNYTPDYFYEQDYQSDYYQPTDMDRQQAIARMNGNGGMSSNLGQIRDGAAPSSIYSEDEYIRLFGLRAFNSRYYANGGAVGPQGTDTVNAWLTPGEFVVNKKATQMYGPLLDAINKQGIGSSMLNKVIGPYFAEGGLIPSMGYRNVAFAPRDTGNTYVSNDNEFNLNATGSAPVDASRLVYFINKQQRSGVAQFNSRRSRAY